jgi:hypothetical protein
VRVEAIITVATLPPGWAPDSAKRPLVETMSCGLEVLAFVNPDSEELECP